MGMIRHLISGFMGGELDPLMSGRVDTENYAYGLELCENFVPVNEGPIVKRPGFEFIRDADASATWLSAFRFSITQEYVIEWGEQKARFFTNGVRIETGPNVPYELAVPYGAADAPSLSFQQSFDRLYIDHAGYPPSALVRTTAITFSHANSILVDGPFLDQNSDRAVTVTASGVSGSVTISSTAALFEAGQEGSPIRIEALDFADLKAWEPGMKDVAIGDKIRSDGKAYVAATGGTTGSVQPTHVRGSAWDGLNRSDLLNDKGPFGVRWTYLHDRFGIAVISEVTSPTSAIADVTRRLPDSIVTTPTFRWSVSAFSSAKGWPSLVTHWSGRQIHIKGFDVIGSVAGDFGGGRVNFATHTDSDQLTEDLAFRRTIAESDPPLWIAGDRKLILGTANKELALGPINQAAPLSGSNISIEPQSFYGSEAVFPVQIGTETVFLERGARRLRSAGYDFARDRYAAVDLTATARHVTRGGIVQMAYQRVPYALLYGVRGDGQLVVHPNTRLDVKGFARTVLGGDARALSAVSVVGSDGKTDELWILVARATPLGERREIWRQTAWRELGDDIEQSFFVDGGVKVQAAAGQTRFTGAVHLAGQAVAVLAAGGVVPGIVVEPDGSFELPPTAVPDRPYTLIVGLAYTATAITLRPEVRVNSGTMQGLKQRIMKVGTRLLETLGLRAGGRDGDLEELIDRPGNALMDSPIPAFTGDVAGRVSADYNRDGRARWISADPLPAIVNSAVLNIDVDQNDV